MVTVVLLAQVVAPVQSHAQKYWVQLSQATVSDPVTCFAVSAAGPMYAGTVSSGVLKSTDGGTNWTGVNNGFQFANNQVTGLAINSSNHVFVSKLSDWMYRSTSEGGYWDRDTVGLRSWMAASLNRRKDGTLFAGFNNGAGGRGTGGVYRSTNEGASWVQTDTTTLTTPLKTSFKIVDLAMKGPGFQFVAFQDSGVGVFVSTNNGTSWSQARLGMAASTQVSCLGVTNSGTILCGTFTEGVYRSTDNGAGWATSNTGMTSSNVHAFAVTRFGLVFAATNGGVFRSTDDGKNWTEVNSGLTDSYIYSLGVDSSGRLLAGSLNGRVFRTSASASILDPVLTSPADGATNLANPVVLTWNAVPNADGYHLQVSQDSAFGSGTINVPNQTATSYNFSAPDGPAVWYWRVRGTVNAEFGPFSATRRFSALGPLPDAPLLVSPADSATWVQIPTTFTWRAAAHAVSYRIQASHYSNFTNLVIDQSGLTDTTLGPVPGLGYGSRAYWRVTAVNAAGTAASATGTFTTRGGSIPAPTPSSPSDGATGVPLPAVVSWFPVAAATSYRVRASMEQYLVDAFIDSSGIPGTSFTFPRLGPSTKYYWQVASESDTLPGAWWSGTWSFTTVQGVPLSPLHKTPLKGEQGVTAGSVLFVWIPPGSVYSYALQVASDSNFASIVLDVSSLPYASYAPTTSPFVAGTTYYWRVRATNGSGTGPWSSPWSFKTAGTALASPTLLGPAKGIRNLVEPFTYNWTTVSGASAYNVQVATDSLFNSIVTGLGRTNVSVPPVGPQSSPIAGTVYYWRVNATDGTSTGPWSSVWSFATVSGFGTPSPSSPSNGAGMQGSSVSFSWSTVPNATAYHWQLSTNSTFSPLVSEHSSLPSAAHAYSNLTTGTTYYWRVRAGNGTSWGGYSSTFSFSALPAIPASYALATTITFPSKGSPGNYATGDYRLFGIPGQSGVDVSSLLPGKPEENWRVSWDNGNLVNWIVRYDGGFRFTCTPGKGFWLLATGPVTISTSVPAPPLNASSEVEIPVHNGWNIISNPFNASLRWSAVTNANGMTDPIYGFNGGGFATATTMEPYTGYYYYNSRSFTLLRMPYAGLFKTAVPENDPADWRVTITLAAGDHIERAASFAVAAPEEAPKLNFRKPRALEDVPAVWFDRPEWDPASPCFATDVRPAGAILQSWDFTVRAERGAAATLGFEGLRSIPAGMAARLLDHQRLRSCDLGTDSLYHYDPALPVERFTVLVGAPEEVRAQSEAILPLRFALLNPFPNPFNPAVTIPVDLASNTDISLSVFDILGARIRVLFAGPAERGRGWFVWDARDDAGRAVASGTYLIVLQGSGVPRMTTRVVYVR